MAPPLFVLSSDLPSPLEDPSIYLPHLDIRTAAGITVAVIGNILISLALNLQKLAHKRLDRKRAAANRHAASALQRARSGSITPTQTQPAANGWASQEAVPLLGGSSRAQPQSSSERSLLFSSSDSHLPSITYGSGGGITLGPGDEPRSRKTSRSSSSVMGRGRRRSALAAAKHGRKTSLATRFLPFRASFGSGGAAAHDGEEPWIMPVDVVERGERGPLVREGNGKAPASMEDLEEGEHEYLKSKLWWLGFGLMNVGEAGNFISYAFAPASLVAPLGTFALIANCFFAPLLLRERFRKRDLFGILLAIIGAVTVVLSSPSSDEAPVLTPPALVKAICERRFVVFSLCYLVGAIVLGTLSRGMAGRRNVLIDIGLCAIFGGFTVLATKAISTLLTKEWFNMFKEWITYPLLLVLVATGILQIRYLNRALQRFDAKLVIPTQFVLFTLSAVTGSAVLYGDFNRATFHQMVTFLYGCGATFAGVFVIAWAAPNSEDDEDGQAGNASALADGAGPVGAADIGALGGSASASRVGSVSRAGSRPVLVMPRGARETPLLRNKPSAVSLVGLSPAQHLLLVHTPPRDREQNWDQREDDRDGESIGSVRGGRRA